MTDKTNHRLEPLHTANYSSAVARRSHGWGIAIYWRSQSMPHRVAQPRPRHAIDCVRVTECSTCGILPQSCNQPRKTDPRDLNALGLR